MNLAYRDIRHNLFRFLLTCVGLGLLLGVVVAGALSHFVIDNDFELSGARGVRASIALILLPGIVSLHPRVHAAQAVLLCAAIAVAATYLSRPIG